MKEVLDLVATHGPGMRADMPMYSITDSNGNRITSDVLKQILGEAE